MRARRFLPGSVWQPPGYRAEWPEFDPDDPLGQVPASFVALAGPNVAKVEKVQHFGDPAIAKSRTAKVAMNLLRLQLIEG